MKKLDMKNAWVVNWSIVLLLGIAIFCIYALSGCKTCEPVVVVKDSIRTEIKAVPVEVPVFYEDSTYALLWLQCNENNEVVMKQAEYYKGKYTDIFSKLEAGKLLFKTKTGIKDSVLYISRDTNTYNSHMETIKVNELTKGQNTRLTLFWCFLVEHILLFLIGVVYTVFRFKSKILGFLKPK